MLKNKNQNVTYSTNMFLSLLSERYFAQFTSVLTKITSQRPHF